MEPMAIATDLIVAERERKAITPFTHAYPFLDLGTAYRAQWLGVEDRLDRGERLVGAKLGLTSRAMRRAIGIEDPLYGWLTSNMIVPAGERLPLEQLIGPRAEPEIAFLIGADLHPPATITSVLAATEAVFAAIEVLDSRYGASRYRPPDAVADNLAAARIVLGPQARRPSELLDLRLIGCVFREHGEVVGTAAGGAVIGHPAAAVAWLINAFAADGNYLSAGSIVLSGGLTAPVRLRPGGVVSAEFDGLGSIEIFS